MAWLRSQAGKLSIVALFALALQFGLSFGHVHHDGAFAAVSVSHQTDAATPDTDQDRDAHQDLCAICVTVAMTHTIVDAVPPMLPLPATFAEYRIHAVAAVALPETLRFAFQSRAPPRS